MSNTDKEIIQLTYITIHKQSKENNKKTDTYLVNSESNDIIGKIKWYVAWRKYCFFPEEDTVYENKCLEEISNILIELTKNYKERKKTMTDNLDKAIEEVKK